MEKESYVFVPAPGAPTVKKIRKFTYQLLGFITFAAIVALFSRETIWQLGFLLLIWVVLCAFVIILISTNVYVIEIRINPVEGMLYFTFMNYKGEVGEKMILKGTDAKLEIGETRSENKNLVNVFFRPEMDKMDRLIREVRSQNKY